MAIPLLFACLPARAQTSTTEFLPEIDANFKLNSYVRFVFQAKDTREGGDPTQAEIGPSIEFYLKPLLKLKNVTVFDLDDAKSRPLVLAVGYRVVPSPGEPTINQMESVLTLSLCSITTRLLLLTIISTTGQAQNYESGESAASCMAKHRIRSFS